MMAAPWCKCKQTQPEEHWMHWNGRYIPTQRRTIFFHTHDENITDICRLRVSSTRISGHFSPLCVCPVLQHSNCALRIHCTYEPTTTRSSSVSCFLACFVFFFGRLSWLEVFVRISHLLLRLLLRLLIYLYYVLRVCAKFCVCFGLPLRKGTSICSSIPDESQKNTKCGTARKITAIAYFRCLI